MSLMVALVAVSLIGGAFVWMLIHELPEVMRTSREEIRRTRRRF